MDISHRKDCSPALQHLLTEAAGSTYSSQISGGRRARPLGSPPGAWGTRRGWSACRTKHRDSSGTAQGQQQWQRCSPASGSLSRGSPAVERTGHTPGSLVQSTNSTLLSQFIFSHSGQWGNLPEPRTPVCLCAVNTLLGQGTPHGAEGKGFRGSQGMGMTDCSRFRPMKPTGHNTPCPCGAPHPTWLLPGWQHCRQRMLQAGEKLEHPGAAWGCAGQPVLSKSPKSP